MERVLYLWDADYPWDVRTEKIALSLTDSGVSVTIVASNRRRSSESEQHSGDVDVYRTG